MTKETLLIRVEAKFNHFEALKELDEATMMIEEPCSAPVSVPRLLAEEAKKAGLKVIHLEIQVSGDPENKSHSIKGVALILKLETLQLTKHGWKLF